MTESARPAKKDSSGFYSCFNLSIVNGACIVPPGDSLPRFQSTITVTWEGQTVGNQLRVSTASGQMQTFTIPTATGSQMLSFLLAADGSENPISVQNINNPGCPAATKSYPPSTDLSIGTFTLGACVFNPTTLLSSINITVPVTWNNIGLGQTITVTGPGGVSATISTTSVSGTSSVIINVPANGTTNNVIRAAVTTGNFPCAVNTKKYTSPPACPRCVLRIASVEVGSCEYNMPTMASTNRVTVELFWVNASAPGTLSVTLGGQTRTHAYTATTGTDTLQFIVPANGGTSLPITACLLYTSDAADE